MFLDYFKRRKRRKIYIQQMQQMFANLAIDTTAPADVIKSKEAEYSDVLEKRRRMAAELDWDYSDLPIALAEAAKKLGISADKVRKLF